MPDTVPGLATPVETGPVPVAGITTLLQALADPVRLAIVGDLARSEAPICCGQLHVPVTKSTLSHHLQVLREAGLIEQRCDGTRRYTRLRLEDVERSYPGLLASLLRATDRS